MKHTLYETEDGKKQNNFPEGYCSKCGATAKGIEYKWRGLCSSCAYKQYNNFDYGEMVLVEVIEKIKNMSPAEYERLYEACFKNKKQF